MKKKLVSVLLAGVMTVGMLAGCGSSKGESTAKSKDYDLTLYSVMTTDPDFDEWLKNVGCHRTEHQCNRSSDRFRYPSAESYDSLIYRRCFY